MSEERLQEIKDSIEFQYTLAKAKGYDNALLFTNEEEELVEEIDRLNKRIDDLNIINEEHRILNGMIRKELQQKENIIKEVREYIESYMPNYDFDKTNLLKILEILDKGE